MKKRIAASMLALPFAVTTAYAQDTSPLHISGFGTGALTWTDNDQAQFARPNQASGAKKHPITGVDSNLGLQADYAINDWLSVTGQGLVRKDAEDDYGAELTWAFVKAKLSDDVSVRVGRVGLPVFMISDYRNVGYANTFLRPPVELYSQVPLNSIDGADITWQHSYGDTTYTAQFAAGRTKVQVPGGLSVDGRSMTAINLVAEHGPVTVRLGRADAKLTLNNSTGLTGLLAGLRATGTGYRFGQLNQLADDLSLDHKKASFTSAGVGLDWNNVVVQTEYAKRKTDSYVSDTTSWYAMGGYRFGKVLPYYIHSQLRIDSYPSNTVPGNCPAGYPAACTPTLAALSAGVNALTRGGNSAQTTDSIGVRWDFYRSVDLKVQIDRVRPKDGNGLFVGPQAGFHGPVTVGSVALDFVF